VSGVRIVGVPQHFDVGGEGGVGAAFDVEHASTSRKRSSDMEESCDRSM
jgi:hypothetical protein